MQPPPRAGPPGASGPPPSGPNMFRRTRPLKHTAAPATQPMMDPFAFVRAPPPPMAAGGLPTIPNSNPPPMQAPPNAMYSQAGSGLPPQPQTLENVPAAPLGPPLASLPGVTLFNPISAASPGGYPAPGPVGYASSHQEQGYFNSTEQTPSMAAEPPPVASAPGPTPFNHEFQGQAPPQPGFFQPVPPTSSYSQWAPDHGTPSLQNNFQTISDPPPQPFNVPLQSQTNPSHTPLPHHNTPTPPTQPGHPPIQAPLPPQNPVNAPTSQWSDPNAPQQHNSHFQSQNYFSQSSAPQDSWFSTPPQDSGYHQMGTGLAHPQLRPDSVGSQHASNTCPGPSSAAAPVPCSQESGTLSMFFKDNDVENEETLAGERNKTVNGTPGSFQHHNNPQTHSQSQAEAPLDYQGPSVHDHSHLPYMNDGSHAPPASTQKPPDSQYDHVENLECVPNQEVLPSEVHGSPAAPASHVVGQFETGPNLETPDSVPRPIRSASVSSNYSNMSIGSESDARCYQGVAGTFILQESPCLTGDASLTAVSSAVMQPPPRAGPPGASGPSPSGPNMFHRTRPLKHTAAPATLPIMDPLAFVRAPPPPLMLAVGLPTIPSSNPPPIQAPPNAMYSQAGSGLPPQPQTLENVPAAPLGPPLASLPGVTLFNPHSAASPGGYPAPGPVGYASSHQEQGYFNSTEQTPSMAAEPLPVASAPGPTPFNHEFQGQPPPQPGSFQPVSFQPVPPTSSYSQWAPDHETPSLQNNFQTTSDPPPQPFNVAPQSQTYPSHTSSSHHNTPTPPTQPGHPPIQAPLPPQNPVNAPTSQWSDPNAPQQHNSHFQSQNYFSQSSAHQDSWFSMSPQDSGYHQMGTGLAHPQPRPDSVGSHHASNTGPGPSSAAAPVPYSQESGTLSMFFKDNDVENEETLAGERNKTVNGTPGSFQHHNNPQTHSQSQAEAILDYQGPPVHDHSHLPYMNDGSHAPPASTQKPPDSQLIPFSSISSQGSE